uniref:Uncharacterized protein n=1 Tax=Oryza sativa subsp. japonica TaxID=39947 RepID=Q6Z8J4_ORYSJ|nr:hypothetical protein [Oryza sativa Japonica Group]
MAMLVCNPATQELVVLPPSSGSGPCPRSTESTAAIGFDRMAEQRMQDQSRAISPGGRRPAACTRGGFFYWFINDSQPCALLWFSLRDEAFDAVPSSLGCTACDNNDRLADLTGELCYVHRVRTSVATHEVWMAAAVDDDDQECQRWFHNFGATAAGDDGVEEEATLVGMLYKELWWHRERSKQL